MSVLRVAVTGHRPGDLFGYDMGSEGWQWLRQTLAEVLTGFGVPVEAISGMALGVDQVFAEVAIDEGVPVVAYVPFRGQDGRWPPESRATYLDLLAQCAREVVVSPVASAAAFLRRNEAMVQVCDVLVAVWNGKTEGGTYHCLQYGLAQGRPVLHVDPVRRAVTLVAG